MGFACSYLENRAIFPESIKDLPDARTGIIVVIPAFNEHNIIRVIESLSECTPPECGVEVIIVINSPAGSPTEYIDTNRKAISDISEWKKIKKECFFRIHLMQPDTSSFSKWGVGLARKTGMDEAVRRFDLIDRTDGIILCLDADCTVRSDYLKEIYNAFFNQKRGCGCSIYFEHSLNNKEYSDEVCQAAALYELHLRYYLQGVIYTGYPNAFHTVGSAIAVQALPYVRAGGMNRRQAGEDFYFVLKLVSQCRYFYLKTTIVYPSPRPSSRVPFGTGMTVSRMIETGTREFLTYNPKSFIELRNLFSRIDSFFTSMDKDLRTNYYSLPESVRHFIGIEQWIGKLSEIRNNTASLITFRKRFYEWFNMFRIVKYLNFIHSGYFPRISVEDAAKEMLELAGKNKKTSGISDLLWYFRTIELES